MNVKIQVSFMRERTSRRYTQNKPPDVRDVDIRITGMVFCASASFLTRLFKLLEFRIRLAFSS